MNDRADAPLPRRSAGDESARISRSIRALRVQRGLTLSSAAKMSDISSAHLSRIENGERSPSITILLQLARAFEVPLGVLIGEDLPQAGQEITVHRARPAPEGRTAEISFEVLGSSTAFALLQPIRVLLPAEASTPRRSHDGDEWIHVERGGIELEVGSEAVTLSRGDSAQFSAVLEHRITSRSRDGASLLLVSSVTRREHH